jgi:hypothetical protein
MTSNPYSSESSPIGSDAPVTAAPPAGIGKSTWRATKSGARIAAIFGGAISLLFIIPAFALAAFGLGSGGGWALPRFIYGGPLLFLYFVGLGAIIGALIGFLGALIRMGRKPRAISRGLAAPEPTLGPSSPAQAVSSPVEMIALERPRVLWPWITAAAISIAILIVSIAGYETGTILGRSIDGRLSAAIEAADRDDPNWRFDDLLANRESVPDEENSSLVMDEVLGILPKGWLATTSASSAPKGTRREKVKEDFVRLEATPENSRLSDAVADSFRVELQTYEKAVKLARTLTDYRRGRHDLVIGPTLFDTPLPQTQDVRIVARLLTIDAAMRAHDGDVDGALDSTRAILGAGRSIGDEPFLISELVRFAVGSVALKSARRALGQGVPSDASLARLQSAIADELAQPLLVVPLRGERAVYVELISRVSDGEIPISALSGSPQKDQLVPRPADSPWTGLWFDNQIVVYLEWMNEAVDIAKGPAFEQPTRWVAWQANIDRVKRSQFGIYAAMLPLLLSPATVAAGTAFSRYQGELGATVILIAAERHRRKTGSWPASIAEIDRSILSAAPVDPYSGRPFRLERRDGKLFIYSIGPNGKDEHGEFDPKRFPKGGLDDVGAVAWDVSLRGRKGKPDE